MKANMKSRAAILSIRPHGVHYAPCERACALRLSGRPIYRWCWLKSGGVIFDQQGSSCSHRSGFRPIASVSIQPPLRQIQRRPAEPSTGRPPSRASPTYASATPRQPSLSTRSALPNSRRSETSLPNRSASALANASAEAKLANPSTGVMNPSRSVPMAIAS